MVEVDVCHHGQCRFRTDALEAIERGGIWNGHTDNLAASVSQTRNLSQRRLSISRVGRTHGLHAHRRATTYGHTTHHHRTRLHGVTFLTTHTHLPHDEAQHVIAHHDDEHKHKEGNAHVANSSLDLHRERAATYALNDLDENLAAV